MNSHFVQDIDRKPISAREFGDLFLGKRIGKGVSRAVYENRQDKTTIVKHEIGQGFQNAIEWELWKIVKNTQYAKWFAPCVDISPNGVFLIQKKVEFPARARYPKLMPAFFSDFKYTNYGLLYKQFVCCDYGGLEVLLCTGLTKRTRKAHWWELES